MYAHDTRHREPGPEGAPEGAEAGRGGGGGPRPPGGTALSRARHWRRRPLLPRLADGHVLSAHLDAPGDLRLAAEPVRGPRQRRGAERAAARPAPRGGGGVPGRLPPRDGGGPRPRAPGAGCAPRGAPEAAWGPPPLHPGAPPPPVRPPRE